MMFINNMSSSEVNNQSLNKILLVMLPYWDPMIPPNGIAHLKSFLQGYGYNVKTVDLIVEDEFQDIYRQYFDELKKCIPEKNRGNFINIGHDVLQNHLMAHNNYKCESDYIELVKELVYKTYYTNISEFYARELNKLMDRFYNYLEKCFIELLDKEKPDVLGLSVYKATIPASLYACKLTRDKYPHIRTIMGGGAFADTHTIGSPNFDILLKESEKYLDKIIIGQGELLLLKYLQGELPNSQRVYTKADINGKILEFSNVGIPDYSDYNLEHYPYIPATGSSSCLYQCSFCNSVKYWGKYRTKDVRQTVKEMTELYKKNGHQLFFMTDALLNPIVTDLANELINANMSLYYDTYFKVDEASANIENTMLWRRGGLYRVRLGTESGSNRILSLMNKGITIEQIKATVSALAYAGIKTTTYWVIGHPGESEEEFQQTLDIITELKDDIFQAECNPFLYHYTGQANSDIWEKKRMSLYSQKSEEMLIFKSWTLNEEPLREEAYKRSFRFVEHCSKLGIPNPYSLSDHMKADERWKRLHEYAVPALMDLQNYGIYVDENKRVPLLVKAKRVEADDKDFAF